jgi:hypothetical protein
MRHDEISIYRVAVNGAAFATGVTPAHVNCLADGGFAPVEHYAEYKSLMDQVGSLSRLVAEQERLRSLREANKRAPDDLHTAVSRMRPGIRGR